MRGKDAAMMVTRAGDGVGVGWHRGQLVAAIDVHGAAHVPAILAGRGLQGAPTVAMSALEDELAAIGAAAPVSVDLCMRGRRLARTTYANVYDTLLAGRPLAGARRTVAILRFDPRVDAGYWAARPSLPEAAAVIVERLRQALAIAGCPATALTRGQLAALAARSATRGAQRWSHLAGATATLSTPVFEYDPDAEERWSRVDAPPREPLTQSVYGVDPVALRADRLRELWSVRADEVALVARRDRRGRWSALASVWAPRPPSAPPLPYLRTLPGQQAAAAQAGTVVGRPAAVRSVFDTVPSLADDLLGCGPDGQVLGSTAEGHQLVVPLTPAPRRVVLASVSDVYAEQLVVRAAACGARVSVITDAPRRWSRLAGDGVAVVSTGEDPPSGPGELHVYDRVRAPADPDTASVVLTDGITGDDFAVRDRLILDQYDDMISVTATSGETTLIRAVIDRSELAHLPATQREAVRS